MRFTGRLQTWNEERGFGFIRPTDGGQDIFVHVSSLPRPAPGPDEILTFAVALNRDGKKKAVDVRLQRVEETGLAMDRMRSARPPRPARPLRPPRKSWRAAVGTLVILSVLGGYAYKRLPWEALRAEPVAAKSVPASPGTVPRTNVGFRCDGRTMCSQMTSCEEATYFLRNCPGTQMDGNHDNVPCEKQWCH